MRKIIYICLLLTVLVFLNGCSNDRAIIENNKNISQDRITGNIISLDSSNVKSESIKSKKNTVYQSDNELIKRFSIYSFIGLLIIFFAVIDSFGKYCLKQATGKNSKASNSLFVTAFFEL